MHKINRFGIYGIFTLLGLFKCSYVHQQMQLPLTLTWALASVSLLGVIYLPVLFVKAKRRFAVGVVINLLVSAILLADTVYFRNFGIPVPVKALGMAHQLGAVTDDIKNTIFLKDWLLLFDLPIIFLVLKSIRSRLQIRINKFLAANCLVVLACVTVGSSLQAMQYNQTMAVSSFGALSYHISDFLLNQSKNGQYKPQFEQLYKEKQQAYANKGRDYFGIAEGRNLILIQLESFNNYVINRTIDGQELTPFLNRLIEKDTFYFDRFFQTAGTARTADAEFSTLNSTYVKTGQIAYQEHVDKNLYALPRALTDAGYTAWAFHGFKADFWNRINMYPTLGFSRFYSQYDFEQDELIGWGVGDRSFFRQASEILTEAEQPFFAFMVTLTNHQPFFIPHKYKTSSFDTSEYSNSENRSERIFAHYFHSIHYTDHALSEFFTYLQEKGLYENSLIVIYGDHYGLHKQTPEHEKLVSDYLGREYGYEDMLNVPLFIHIPGLGEAKTLHTAGGEIDIMPTILNLLGIEKHPSVVHFGQDLLNINADEGFVALPAYVPQGSFVAGSTYFEMAPNGLFQHAKAYDLDTGLPVPLEECWDNYNRALLEVQYANWIMDNDRVFAPYLP
ncbi:MAG: LTA synthase family protein [Firmicutes bacterium]|nr:LTA synthase family protein [Bacillota bacterium]